MYGVVSLIVTATLLPLLGFLFVCLRFYVRIRLTRAFLGIDDWLIAFSCVLVIVHGANQILGAVIGELGRDGQPHANWRASHQSKLDYGIIIIEKFTYTGIKLSVLFFYRRIFVQRKSFRIANSILIALVMLWGFVFVLMEAIATSPDSYDGHSYQTQEWLLLWFAITDVLGDIAVLALPYPCIRKMQMSGRDKVGLIAIFSLGTLSVIFGIVRLGFVTKTFAISFHPSETNMNSNRTPPGFWTTAEVSVGLTAACLPLLRPLLRHAPSPPNFVNTFTLGIASRRLGLCRSGDRLSSVEGISKIEGSSAEKLEEAKGGETEMSDCRRTEMTEDAAFREIV